MAIGINSEVWVWGDGSKGQLGRGRNRSNKPVSMDDLIGCNAKNGYLEVK